MLRLRSTSVDMAADDEDDDDVDDDAEVEEEELLLVGPLWLKWYWVGVEAVVH